MTQEFKHVIRIVNTDLDGKKQVLFALTKIKGVGEMFANMACKLASVATNTRAGDLTDAEVKRLEEILKEPLQHGAPNWMINRKKDYETGEDKHLLTGDLQLTQQLDVTRLKKIKSYRGLRLQWGVPVRGQRTR